MLINWYHKGNLHFCNSKVFNGCVNVWNSFLQEIECLIAIVAGGDEGLCGSKGFYIASPTTLAGAP